MKKPTKISSTYLLYNISLKCIGLLLSKHSFDNNIEMHLQVEDSEENLLALCQLAHKANQKKIR